MSKNTIEIKNVIISKNGERFLPKEKSGIPVLFQMTDGIKLTTFGKEKKYTQKLQKLLNGLRKN